MTVKIAINGPIISSSEKWIYDYYEEESTCAKDVREALPTNGEDVEVTINSYGGYVDQGAEIYTILKAYSGKVTINVVAAYSAASIIAMAGSPVRISPVGRMMIHNASSGSWGDYHDMDKMSEVLKNANDAMVLAYTKKTGLSKEEILRKMDIETWLTAEQAVDLGFADEIMFESNTQQRLVASYGTGMLSKNVIEKAKATLELPKQQRENSNNLEELVKDQVAKAMSSFFESQEGLEVIQNLKIPVEKIAKNLESFNRQKSLVGRLKKGE